MTDADVADTGSLHRKNEQSMMCARDVRVLVCVCRTANRDPIDTYDIGKHST